MPLQVPPNKCVCFYFFSSKNFLYWSKVSIPHCFRIQGGRTKLMNERESRRTKGRTNNLVSPIFNITGFVLNMTGFVLNMNISVSMCLCPHICQWSPTCCGPRCLALALAEHRVARDSGTICHPIGLITSLVTPPTLTHYWLCVAFWCGKHF